MSGLDGPPGSLWRAGWYGYARRLPSPNVGPRPQGADIDLIVVHSISLPPGHYGGNEVQQLFTNSLDWGAHPYFRQIEGIQVSSHFYIRR
ncbi:MAG: 1,6-anhydro-N-acetylmuramyl-L-alanine amidase AmpD, partial [Ramlibacter sp.]|nr:1,6-anhydro-N-acetylmuramyl-L-alanine amidase AmpD [Ramlibacter sp.]